MKKSLFSFLPRNLSEICEAVNSSKIWECERVVGTLLYSCWRFCNGHFCEQFCQPKHWDIDNLWNIIPYFWIPISINNLIKDEMKYSLSLSGRAYFQIFGPKIKFKMLFNTKI